MKTTTPAALMAAPSSHPRPAQTPAGDPALTALASAIVHALHDHRQRLGLADRAYAVRRAWTAGFLSRILADPLGQRVAHVVAALDGTGFALVVARLPDEPTPYAVSATRAQARPMQPQSEAKALARLIRLPPNERPSDADDALGRCA